MTIPLTNTVSANDYEFTALKVIQEFLAEFFNTDGFDASLETVDRKLETPLSKPILFFYISGGSGRKVGGVGVSDSNKALHGEYKNLLWEFRLVTDDTTGGALDLSKYAGRLDYVFRQQQHYLGKSGLRKVIVSPPTPLNTDEFYQKVFTVSMQVLLTWEAPDV